MCPVPTPAEVPPKDVAGLAAYYRTVERNIKRYRAKGAPLDDPVKFKEWISRQKSAPEGLTDRLDELTGGSTAAFGDGSKDWDEFERTARTEDPGEAMAKISKVRDWAFFQFERASKAKKKKEEKFYSDLLAKMEGTLHDAQLRAKKLGIETGDLCSRADLERPARFFAYHQVRCAKAALTKLAKTIEERDPKLPPITAKEVRTMGEPLFLSAMVWEPIEKAAKGDNGAAPPDWLVKALYEGLHLVLE